MSGAFYCRSELTEPWGLTLPPLPGYLWFHVVTSGGSALDARRRRADDASAAATCALVTHGAGHGLRSDPAAPAPGILDLPRERDLRPLRGAAPRRRRALTRMMCGAVRFDHPAARNLVALLPEIIHVDAATAPGRGLDAGRRWR